MDADVLAKSRSAFEGRGYNFVSELRDSGDGILDYFVTRTKDF
jgi:hypothetical protein